MPLMPLLIIARLTLREAARRRLLLAVAILTIAIVGMTGWGFSRLPTFSQNGQPVPHSLVLTTAAALVIVIAYMFSFVLAVGAAFLAAPAIAADVESGLVLAMLPRPIRRSDLVLGKWLGLAALLGCYAALAASLELLSVRVTTGYVPPHAVLAVLFIVGEGLVVLTLALLLSTRLSPMTGGIIALVLFGVAWIAGIVQVIGTTFDNSAIVSYTTVASLLLPSDGLWRGALYNLEPALIIAASTGARDTPFAVTAAPTTAYILWALAWLVVMLALAARRFSRRDL